MLHISIFIISINESVTFAVLFIIVKQIWSVPTQTNWSFNMMTSSNGNIFRVTGLCAGNSPVTGKFPTQRPVTRSFDVFFDLLLDKRLSKQSWGWWFETPSCPLWRYFNDPTNLIASDLRRHYAPCNGDIWRQLMFKDNTEQLLTFNIV